MEARRYADLAARLRDLSAAREQAAARVRRLRDMQRGLAPFRATGPGPGSLPQLQRNLVTKDGELEKELERTRILMARVGDRVLRAVQEEASKQQRRRRPGDGDDAPVAIADEEKRKVADLLDRF